MLCVVRYRSLRGDDLSPRGVLSECDREDLILRRPWPTRGCWAVGGGCVHSGAYEISVCMLLSTQEGGRWRPRWNSELYGLCNEPNIVEDIKIRRLGWAGHIIRMEEEKIPEKALNGNFYTTRPVEDQEPDGRMWSRGMH